MKNFLSYILIFLGVFSIGFASNLLWQRINPNRLSFDQSALDLSKTYQSSTYPKYISIPDLSINAPIYPSEVKSGHWESTTKGISYLSSSPSPGEWGNSILYGHNWNNLLGNLTKAKVGQEIIVVYSDGSQKKFKISFVQTVYPTQSDILNQTDDKRITLYTCTGFMDAKRLVVTALFEDSTLSSI